MRRIFTRTALSVCTFCLVFFSQKSSAQINTGNNENAPRNVIKWNVAALLLNNYSFQYERAVGEKMSLSMGFRYMPKSKVFFKSLIKSAIDDDNTWTNLKALKSSNFALTPEFRLYAGEGILHGFYAAAYLRYVRYSLDLPYTYSTNNGASSTQINFSGAANSYTGGLLVGAQWKLSKQLFLDWSIIGPNIGFITGKISAKQTLSAQEQNALRKALTDFDGVAFGNITSDVDAEGAKLDFVGPWAGFRAGVSIGYNF